MKDTPHLLLHMLLQEYAKHPDTLTNHEQVVHKKAVWLVTWLLAPGSDDYFKMREKELLRDREVVKAAIQFMVFEVPSKIGRPLNRALERLRELERNWEIEDNAK